MAHAHAAMSLFRGLGDDLSLDDWLQKSIFTAGSAQRHRRFCQLGHAPGIDEMLRGGITTYVDMYYFEDAVARVTKEAGLRSVLGETILDFPAPDNKSVGALLRIHKPSWITGRAIRSSSLRLRRIPSTRSRPKI